MVNKTHLKVLLTKDFLTLRRNVGYIIAFIFLPVALMSAFISIQQLVDNGTKEGSLIDDNFFYTSNSFMKNPVAPSPVNVNAPFMDVMPADPKTFHFYASSL